jgi:ankyrin repeat protein
MSNIEENPFETSLREDVQQRGILTAAANGDTSTLRLNYTPGWRNKKIVTPMHVASFHGHREVVMMLVQEMQAKINIQDAEGNTPLMYASKNGKHEVALYLLQCCPSLSLVNKMGKTALMVRTTICAVR